MSTSSALIGIRKNRHPIALATALAIARRARYHDRLADAARSVRARRLLVLRDAHRQFGHVVRGRDLVVDEVAVEDPPVLEHQLLKERRAQGLHHRALHLRVVERRVDDLSGVEAGDHLEHADLARVGVDLDLGAVDADRPEGHRLGALAVSWS